MIFLKGRNAVSLEPGDDFPLVTYDDTKDLFDLDAFVILPELTEWLNENAPGHKTQWDRNQTFWITFASEKDMIAFKLRWY